LHRSALRRTVAHAVPTLIIMCGLPFAGKTTLARALARHLGARVVSLDEINAARGVRGGNGIPTEEWERTHRAALDEAGELLGREDAVVVDDTGCFRWLRDRYREVARRHGSDSVVIFVQTPVEEARRRLAANTVTGERPGVRSGILEELARTFEPPQPDEPSLVFAPDHRLDRWLEEHFPRAG
jgi:predicted kinase